MLKREIRYEDFDGNMTSGIFYFNLSKPEIIELEVGYAQGFGAMLQSIVESQDKKEIVAKFKEIVLMAYGIKSDDGKRFIKSEQLREEFSQTAAYAELFMELATDADKAVVFLNGILPREFRGTITADGATAAVSAIQTTRDISEVSSSPPNT
jgi:hypothetical protein